MKYNLKTNDDRMLFLILGAKNISVSGANGSRGTVDIPEAYPKLAGMSVINDLKVRAKTDKVFGYPYR